MTLTKEEKLHILSLIDKNTEEISKLEGAISDDDWIYETYDMANSIREKFEKDKVEKMSKELQAKPEDISKLLYEVYDVPSGICEYINKALLELKAIKESNPSEALECLERLDIAVRYSTMDDEGYSLKAPRKMTNICDEEFNSIKQALLKAQEQEKVLSIIKEKNVNVELLKDCEDRYEYNTHFPYLGAYQLTQEEFELLKRYFEKNIQKCMFNS